MPRKDSGSLYALWRRHPSTIFPRGERDGSPTPDNSKKHWCVDCGDSFRSARAPRLQPLAAAPRSSPRLRWCLQERRAARGPGRKRKTGRRARSDNARPSGVRAPAPGWITACDAKLRSASGTGSPHQASARRGTTAARTPATHTAAPARAFSRPRDAHRTPTAR